MPEREVQQRSVSPLPSHYNKNKHSFLLHTTQNRATLILYQTKSTGDENRLFPFFKCLDFTKFIWCCVVLPEVEKMNIIKELWHGNIIPQEDSRTNSKEKKELLGYMARHHDNLLKSMTNEQK